MNWYIDGLKYKNGHSLKKAADELAALYEQNAYIDADGAVRWTSTNRVPPKDVLEFWIHIGKTFNFEISLTKQEEDDAVSIFEYRKTSGKWKPTVEEYYELLSAFANGHFNAKTTVG